MSRAPRRCAMRPRSADPVSAPPGGPDAAKLKRTTAHPARPEIINREEVMTFTRRNLFALAATASFAATLAGLGLPVDAANAADDTVKIGMIQPMTGPFASTGVEAVAGAKQYIADHGDTVAGKKIELVVKDDAGSPNETKRIAQELVVNEGANVLVGFGLTPLAFATAPIATQAKVPMVVTAAATSSTHREVALHRAHLLHAAAGHRSIGDWAAKNGIKKVVTLVSRLRARHGRAGLVRQDVREERRQGRRAADACP